MPAWERARISPMLSSSEALRLAQLRDKLAGVLEACSAESMHDVALRLKATDLWDERALVHRKVCMPWNFLVVDAKASSCV